MYLGSGPTVVVIVLGSAPIIVLEVLPAVVSQRFLEVYVASGRLVDGRYTSKCVGATIYTTPRRQTTGTVDTSKNQLRTQPVRTLPSARWPRLYVNFQYQGGHKVVHFQEPGPQSVCLTYPVDHNRRHS